MRYGKRGRYRYRIFDGVRATTPRSATRLRGVPKSGQYSSELYTHCANEAQTCAFGGTRQVGFGANGQWARRVASGSALQRGYFVSPLPGVIKRCEYRDIRGVRGPPGPRPAPCSVE